MKMLLDKGLLHGDCMTVTGKTLKQNLAGVKPYPKGQEVIRPFDHPIKSESHLVILYGNLAPEGAVAKISGKEGTKFVGKARVYESEGSYPTLQWLTPWCLIVAPSFADIFANNCVKNGILLATLKSEEVEELFKQCSKDPGAEVEADLEQQVVIAPDGQKFLFEIHDFEKECLLKGLDQIGWTLQFEDNIAAFEEDLRGGKTWLA